MLDVGEDAHHCGGGGGEARDIDEVMSPMRV